MIWQMIETFRPLSWGLSFNNYMPINITTAKKILFVPFLGDFLSIRKRGTDNGKNHLFVPFLGDFLSITFTYEW